MRDYAQKKPAPKKPQQKNNAMYYFSIVIILLAILFPLSMFYLKYRQSVHAHKQAEIITQNQPSVKATVKEDNSTHFDFYSILPKMQMPNDDANANASDKNPMYVLQVASVTDRSAAQRLQMQLSELGYQSFILITQAKNIPRFQVLTGPYTSTNNAKADQKRLHNQQFDSVLLQQKSK